MAPPLLAVDVDGVISLFGFDAGLGQAPGRFHLIDGVPHCIAHGVGDRLVQLAAQFELFWATGWEGRANADLPALLGIPELPYLTFDGNARFGSAHWKLGPLADYAGDRPLAWIDDSLDEACHRWAAERVAPTLLVPTESGVGLTDHQVEAMIDWALGVRTP